MKKSIDQIVLFLIFFSPVFAYLCICFNGGNTLLFEDGLLAQFPFRVFLHSAFVNGFSPQWVPNSSFGISLLAEGQSGIGFPVTQILYRIFSPGISWIIEIVLADLVAFAFCYIFIRHFGISRLSALLGASIYTFCSFAFIQTAIPAIRWCYSLLPGIFLCCSRFMERRPLALIHLITIFALVFLTGHPVMIIYIGMVITIFFVFHMMDVWSREKTIRDIWPRFLALFGIVVVAAVIASPQLLPMLEGFRFSARSVSASVSSDALQNTVHFNPAWIPLSLLPTPSHWSGYEFLSNSIRFPFYILFLGLIGILFGTKGYRRGYFIFLFLFSILMALGPYAGIWKIVHSLPVIKLFRFPFRWLFFLPICVSCFAAFGLDHLLKRSSESPSVAFRRILHSILIVGFAIGVVFFIRYHSKIFEQTQKALEYLPWLTVLLWLCTTGMVLAAFLSLAKAQTRRGVILGVTITVICLVATLAFSIQDPWVVRDLRMIGWKGDHPPNEPQTFRTTSAVSYDVWNTNTIRRHYRYTPNLTILNGTLTTGHYFSFFPYWAADVSQWCQEALQGDLKKQIYLNLSSSRWLFIPDSSFSDRSAVHTEASKDMTARENPNAIPRASVVSSYRHFSNEDDLITFLESPEEFDPHRELAILKQDAEAWSLPSSANEQKSTITLTKATIVGDRPDRIEIELEPAVPREAFLVLSDTYYPGWRALVDGLETKVLRANYAFRGIMLPEGARHVVFFFAPLVPDAMLPVPTIILALLAGAIFFHHRLFIKHKTK